MFHEKREAFEQTKIIHASRKLTFLGVDGYDVYNCSVPFTWHGETYIFGRVEKRAEWARSWVYLFRKTGEDLYSRVPESMIYTIEDPYVAVIQGELCMGGTYVVRMRNEVKTYWANFYRGHDLMNLYYFTTGPDYMKDIRLVDMGKQGIGVFSRPRDEATEKKYGSLSIVGFTTIRSLDELDDKVVENARVIDGMFDAGEWGGCNQCYLLDSGYIGIIGHKCYSYPWEDGRTMNAYCNAAFVFDPVTHTLLDEKVIGTRSCYPDGPSKVFITTDSAFTSGIVMREDGKCDLYSGINDVEEGVITIDYPFAGFGNIVTVTSL
ncbi:MAG: DUF1861 family protein [Clostridia bacterium]|nr:DUF1861 family protein [Clostridia bacterium]